jgi:hypothetical protein
VFKGSKHVYLDDLPAVEEIDWPHLPAGLESAYASLFAGGSSRCSPAGTGGACVPIGPPG